MTAGDSDLRQVSTPMSESDAMAIRAEMRDRTVAAGASAALTVGFWLTIVLVGKALNFPFALIVIIATSFALIFAIGFALPRLWYRLSNRAASDLEGGTIIQATGPIPLVGTVHHDRSGSRWMTYALSLSTIQLRLPDEAGEEMRAASEPTANAMIFRFIGMTEYSEASKIVLRIASGDGTFHYENRHLAKLATGWAHKSSDVATNARGVITQIPSPTDTTDSPAGVGGDQPSAAPQLSTEVTGGGTAIPGGRLRLTAGGGGMGTTGWRLAPGIRPCLPQPAVQLAWAARRWPWPSSPWSALELASPRRRLPGLRSWAGLLA